MAQPVPFVPGADYSADVIPGDLGNALDHDFDDIALTISQVLANLALIQRDDGELANGSVGTDQISTALFAMLGSWNPRGAWVTATAYAKLDFVTQSGIGYLCTTAHTSGTFATDLAAGKWTAISKVDALASAFTLTLLDDTTAGAWLTTLGLSANAQTFVTAANNAAMRTALGVYSTAQVDAADALAIPKSLVDAKGDILAATAADAVARKAVGSDGSVLAADSAQSDGLIWVQRYPRSLASNPFFSVDQRVNSATARADDTYAFDRWYVLTETAGITCTQMKAQEDGQPYNAKLTQSQASAQRMALASIIEGRDCKHLRGKTVTFKPRLRTSADANVRFAILEWTGTEDAVTSDVISNWASTNYTVNNFFINSTLVPSVATAAAQVANTWADTAPLTVTLGSTFNNLILLVWTESQAAQNFTLEIGKVRFAQGAGLGEIDVVSFADELARCKRYYEKSFDYVVAPQNGGSSSYNFTQSVGASIATNSGHQGYRVSKRANPTVTFYSPGGSGVQVYNFSIATAAGNAAVNLNGPDGFSIAYTTAVGSAAGNLNMSNWTADAEL